MPVPPEKSVYLQLQLCGNPTGSIVLEFVPGEDDIEGLWIDTRLMIPGLPVEFSWFLCKEIQRRLAEIYRGLAAGTIRAPFSAIDTDGTFDLAFVPDASRKHFDTTLTIRALWGGDQSAVNLTIDRCTATYADVQAFVSRMASIE